MENSLFSRPVENVFGLRLDKTSLGRAARNRFRSTQKDIPYPLQRGNLCALADLGNF